MPSSEFSRFNDGVASIYTEEVKRSNFAAKENTRGLDGLNFVCKLAFEEMSKRQQDQEFANQNGFSLSMKIHTRCVNAVNTKCKVVIGNTLYDVYDLDKTRTDLYLYLEEVRELAT